MTPQERIVEQALRLFVTQGIKSVRMEDLARLAGVSKRVLYDMFEDKENLLYRVMLRYFEQNREHWRQQSAGAGNVLEELFMVLGDMMDRSEQTGRLMESLRRFYPALHERLRHEGIERNAADLRRCCSRASARGCSSNGSIPTGHRSALLHHLGAGHAPRARSFPRNSPNATAFVQII
ncbi:putative transcriptional regulator, partial [human gut metagenome]